LMSMFSMFWSSSSGWSLPTGNPAGYPGDPYAVTVPPGSGLPMAGYADAGWASAPAPPPPAAPPPEERRELPRGRHSGSHPAHPAHHAGEAG